MARKFPEKVPFSSAEAVLKQSGIAKGKKIEIAPQKESGSKELMLYVEHALDVLGHPEAIVTDESQVWDFVTDEDEIAEKVFLKKASEKLGLEVSEKDYIIDIAKKLKEKNESKNRP